jgi:hypothetical protein
MTGIDHSLVYNARKFITGANAHSVKTWIFCYENLPAGRRDQYEKLLREFVGRHYLTLAMPEELDGAWRRCS